MATNDTPTLSSPETRPFEPWHFFGCTAGSRWDLRDEIKIIELDQLDAEQTLHAWSAEGSESSMRELADFIYGEKPTIGWTFEGPQIALPTIVGWRGGPKRKQCVEIKVRHIAWDGATFWAAKSLGGEVGGVALGEFDAAGGLLEIVTDDGGQLYLVDGLRYASDDFRREPQKGPLRRN